jgi:hypothetical protein
MAVVYFFDPAWLGRRPLDLYKVIAEKCNWRFCGFQQLSHFFSGASG